MPFQGILLAATGVDANGSLYPLAYVVVDAENDDNWLWMLQYLRQIVKTHPPQFLEPNVLTLYRIARRVLLTVLRMSSLIVLMGIACDILKPIFTNNSSTHSLSHCFGKLHVQQLKLRLTKPLRTCRRLMNVQLIGFCNMPTQNIRQNCILSESAMGTSPRISLNH